MADPVKTHKGYLIGPKLDVVSIARLCYSAGWRDKDLVTAVAVCLSESAGYVKARCENFVDGVHVSTDFGLFQLNYGVEDITPDLLVKVYTPEWNVAAAYTLWKRRGFQPWHGYTSNIATNPEMKGKYIQRATWGVMNLTREQFGMKGVPSPYVPLGAKRVTWWLSHPELKS